MIVAFCNYFHDIKPYSTLSLFLELRWLIIIIYNSNAKKKIGMILSFDKQRRSSEDWLLRILHSLVFSLKTCKMALTQSITSKVIQMDSLKKIVI
jgi:hypothetical protein